MGSVSSPMLECLHVLVNTHIIKRASPQDLDNTIRIRLVVGASFHY